MKTLLTFVIVVLAGFGIIQYVAPLAKYPWDVVIIVMTVLVGLAYLGKSIK